MLLYANMILNFDDVFVQIHKEVRKTMGDVLRKRQMSSDKTPRDDLLDHLIQDMNKETFLNEDFIVQLMFGLLFVTSDSISTTMALAFKLLAEHPLVLEELTVSNYCATML